MLNLGCVLGETYVTPGGGRSAARAVNAGANSARAMGMAAKAPRNWARMNAGTCDGAIPAKVFVKERAILMAGFANDVDEGNQYAAPIHAATIQSASSWRR